MKIPVLLGLAALAPSARAASLYSMPWQLRPATAETAARVDSAFALADVTNTVATMITGSWKLSPSVAPLVRLGVVTNSPDAGDGATAFVNPVVGVTWAPRLRDDLKLALFLGLALPVGQGGGEYPNLATAYAVAAGEPARSEMDNAMFAVNYFTIFPGLDVAWVKDGFTAQIELTILQMLRDAPRGEYGVNSSDPSRTELTAGLHVGYFFVPYLSLGVELRNQSWLVHDRLLYGGRSNSTLAIGPRFHVETSAGWFGPGISYSQPLDEPLSSAVYRIIQVDRIIQIDLPFVFK